MNYCFDCGIENEVKINECPHGNINKWTCKGDSVKDDNLDVYVLETHCMRDNA